MFLPSPERGKLAREPDCRGYRVRMRNIDTGKTRLAYDKTGSGDELAEYYGSRDISAEIDAAELEPHAPAEEVMIVSSMRLPKPHRLRVPWTGNSVTGHA